MTRRKNPKTAENEARVQEALAAVRAGQYTCHTVHFAFNVPRRTLYDRMNGKLPCKLVQEHPSSIESCRREGVSTMDYSSYYY